MGSPPEKGGGLGLLVEGAGAVFHDDDILGSRGPSPRGGSPGTCGSPQRRGAPVHGEPPHTSVMPCLLLPSKGGAGVACMENELRGPSSP